MKRNLVRILMLVVLTFASPFAIASKNLSRETRNLTVRVMDYVGLTPGARSEMETNSKRILATAGIKIDFITCRTGGIEIGTGACTILPGPADLVLRIFQPRLAVKEAQRGYTAMTPEGGAYITIFIDPAQQNTRVSNLSNGAFLGHALAHEIGHLLLGANSHSSAGIMRPVWRTIDEEWMAKGALLFDAKQSAKMQLELAKRVASE